MSRMSPRTVLVHENRYGYFVWRCSCGKQGADRDERKCRYDGLVHQQSHIAEIFPRDRSHQPPASVGSWAVR